MRPDEHKSKESRRYQQKKKKEGDNTAAEVAEARRRRAKANDKGTSIAAIRRRNGELPSFSNTTNTGNPPTIKTSHFSKRKITSNRDRYQERSLQDDIDQDAELGIDRETTDLVTMLEDAEGHLTGGSTFFKFKEEQELSMTGREDMYQDLLQVDFSALERKFQQTETRILLDLPSDDAEVIDCVFEQDYIGLDIPLVPAMNKTSQGVIMLKPTTSSLDQQQNRQSSDGIYLRNNHITQSTASKQEKGAVVTSKGDDDAEKELDALLGLDSPKKEQDIEKAKPVAPSTTRISKPGLPKLKVPGSSQKLNEKEKPANDQAWLDDLLG